MVILFSRFGRGLQKPQKMDLTENFPLHVCCDVDQALSLKGMLVISDTREVVISAT